LQGQPSRSTELLPFGGGLSSFFQDPFFSTFGALDFPGGGGLTSGLSSALTRMKLDIRENDASFEVSADVPGISK
jgi:HSP20 family molecular chaperone IbpA